MIIDSYDVNTEPMISCRDMYGNPGHIADTCLIIFSNKIHQHLLDTYKCEEAASIAVCNGNIAIYKMNYKGKDVVYYLSGIGSAVASACCCEASWLTGATKFVMFGSCGSLDSEKTDGRFVVPTEVYRGDGCSYYFAPPSDYLPVKNNEKLARIFDQLHVPYVRGKVWTTDSMIRETKGLVAKRKNEGCIAVEMELAGVQSTCDFYRLELYDFLEAGDVLETSGYKIEGLHNANHSFGKLYVGLEVALRI
ncbi:MAG: nucleoside phosphorylase [Eubacteriales bacterium]